MKRAPGISGGGLYLLLVLFFLMIRLSHVKATRTAKRVCRRIRLISMGDVLVWVWRMLVIGVGGAVYIMMHYVNLLRSKKIHIGFGCF